MHGKFLVNAHDEKQEERRMPANLRRGIELMELAQALRLATLQHPNVVFFNVAFRDRQQSTLTLPRSPSVHLSRELSRSYGAITWTEYHADKER